MSTLPNQHLRLKGLRTADAGRWLAEFSLWRALIAAHLWTISATNDY